VVGLEEVLAIKMKVEGKGLTGLLKILNDLNKKDLSIGWFEGNNYSDGVPTAWVASLQEYGNESTNLPPREFLYPTQTKNADSWMKQFSKGIKAGAEQGMTGENLLTILGGIAVSDVREEIKGIEGPPLKLSTIKSRASRGLNTTDILRATGHMISTITFVIEDKINGTESTQPSK